MYSRINYDKSKLFLSLKQSLTPKMNTFKTAGTYHYKILKKYQKKIKQQQFLINIVKKSLSKSLANHVLSCFILDNALVIYTDSAIWASQLHFYQTSILKNISLQNITSVTSFHVKIQQLNHSQQKKIPSLQRPSEENIHLVRACSDSIQDEKLKKALLRLSNALSNKH